MHAFPVLKSQASNRLKIHLFCPLPKVNVPVADRWCPYLSEDGAYNLNAASLRTKMMITTSKKRRTQELV